MCKSSYAPGNHATTMLSRAHRPDACPALTGLNSVPLPRSYHPFRGPFFPQLVCGEQCKTFVVQ